MKSTNNTSTTTNRAETLRVVLVRPDEKAEIVEIEKGLESYQKTVDGYIEFVYPFDDDVAIVCNEEGKINGLPLNRALYDESGEIYDIVAGTFFIVGLTEDDTCGLTDELAEKYRRLFDRPEVFARIGGRVCAFSV